MLTLTFLTSLVVMATSVVAIELTITRHMTGGFQCDFCYTFATHVHGWKGHIVFEHPVDTLDVYRAVLSQTLHSGSEYVVTNEPYNADFEAGEKLCLKFTAHTTSTAASKVYFYIEGIDHPVDVHGVTHPIPATTPDPKLTAATQLWQLHNIPASETDPLVPFHSQKSGGFDEGSLGIANDPAGLPGKVLSVFYGKGQYIHTHHARGAQFYSRPTGPRTEMTLSYDIYFSPGFDWVKGGKLPGLFGGATNCSGGRHSDLCFSTRLMWRTNGDGEVYAYIPTQQDPALCHQTGNLCNPDYGASLGRGDWRFKTGVWQTITQHVTLNTPTQLNGKVKVWFNGQPVLEFTNINFRNTPDILIEGLFFSTFFGGSDASWAPTADCYTYYKNFAISTGEGHTPVVG